MASLRLEPLSAFNFRTPDEWPCWKKQFEQVCLVSGLSGDAEEKHVSTLLYCMGEDADDTLTSTNSTADKHKQYQTIITKLDGFFQVWWNVIFEWARFNCCVQKEWESVEQFITSLYNLVETCDYGDLKDKMIRTELLLGFGTRLYLNASKRLQTLVRQRSSTWAPTHPEWFLKGGQVTGLCTEAIQPQREEPPSKEGPKHTQGPRIPSALDVIVVLIPDTSVLQRTLGGHKCHKWGHYSAKCFSKSVMAIHEPPESVDDFAFLNTVGSDHGAPWTYTIRINGQDVLFKVDTGAEVTFIWEEHASLLSQDVKLPSKQLHGLDSKPLSVVGEIKATMTYKEKQAMQTIFVVCNLQHNLVGLPAIQDVDILTRIDAISTPIKEQFPSLFTGLVTFQGGSYRVQLKPDSTPFALSTPRNVPLPLRDKVRDELTQMEALGAISPVEEPTPWCAGMVIVPKKSNRVRICVNYHALNESMLQEVCPLSKVNETLAKMAGAPVFSQLDANCGFW